MSQPPDHLFDHVVELTELYLLGEIRDEQLAELESMVRQDPGALRAMQTCLRQAGMMHVVFAEQRRFASRVGETDRTEYLELLKTLSPVLDPEIVPIEPDEEPHLQRPDVGTLSTQEMLAAGSYLLRHSLTPKVIAAVATAAALVLGATLLIVLSGSEPDPPHLATDPTPAIQPSAEPRVVATLSDEQGARWQVPSGDTAPFIGSALTAGQSLTLTRGFAQVTTNRGAIVLLQAPCTIELTSNNNAIRLHKGRLVGKCLVPSSKGLVVHAPGIDVVDLGTEFGVEADPDHGSSVLVMDGSVRVQPTTESPYAFEPVVLYEDEARRVIPQTGGLEMIASSEAPRFFSQAPPPYAAAVLDAAPVAYWRFEDDAGQSVVNEVEPGRHDLRLAGSAKIDRGDLHGNAGRLDSGVEPFGYFMMDGSLDAASDADVFTFECWFRAEDVLQSTLLSLFEPDPDEIKHIVNIELQPGGGLDPKEGSGWRKQSVRTVHCDPPNIDGSIGTNVYSKAPYRLDAWHYLVVVKEPGRLRVYMDGQPVGDAETGRDLADDARLSLGLTHKKENLGLPLRELARPMDGWIDEVAVYDRVLSEEEIKAHWNAGNAAGRRP